MSSRGIEQATALAVATEGINLALGSRESENLEAVAAAAREVGVKAEAYPLDLAKIEQVQSSISAIASQLGSVDILVNSAGMGYTGSLAQTSLADWQNVLGL